MSPASHRSRSRRRRARGERGVLLVALIVAMTVMMILLTASAQSWTTVIRREREQELIFRGNQYIQALRLYQQEHGGQFPTKLEDLMEEGPRRHRYIRQLFEDPFDKDGEWNLIFLGPDGKSAWNPHARLSEGGIPGLAGVGTASVGRPAGGLPTAGRAASVAAPGSAPAAGPPAGGRQRRSRFASGNINSPIVGVVSKGKAQGFQEYYSRQYYDEWEFHVFLQQVPQVHGRAVPGLNINPTGQIGRGGGIGIMAPNTGPAGVMGPGEQPGTKVGPKASGVGQRGRTDDDNNR